MVWKGWVHKHTQKKETKIVWKEQWKPNLSRRQCFRGPLLDIRKQVPPGQVWFLVVQVGVGKGGIPANLKFPTEWKFSQNIRTIPALTWAFEMTLLLSQLREDTPESRFDPHSWLKRAHTVVTIEPPVFLSLESSEEMHSAHCCSSEVKLVLEFSKILA